MSHIFTLSRPNNHEIITAINTGMTFPESLYKKIETYESKIYLFRLLINESDSSADLLKKIRSPRDFNLDTRMSLLKLFRRCVSHVCDTESTKKITKIPTSVFIDNYGDTFKDIKKLKSQFSNLSVSESTALCALLGEYDNRGEQGYILTERFFSWIESTFKNKLTIEGPRGAGKDIQLSNIFPSFEGEYPCDFIIKDIETANILAIGFARYDSTRGGAQSDDRTGGNNDKVNKAEAYCDKTGNSFKIIFLADGPGLVHIDTWAETCALNRRWGGNVRVTTLKTAAKILTLDWLSS